MIELNEISYCYKINHRKIEILEAVSYKFRENLIFAISSPSGSGKTTLLNILGLLDSPNSGKYFFENTDVEVLSDESKSQLRAQKIGFLFQDFRLVHTISILENILLSLSISNQESRKHNIDIAMHSLEAVGLESRAHFFPAELSGGESQRASFARAMAKQPVLLLADEPTGNLDAINREIIVDLILQFQNSGGTVVVVTHDPFVSSKANVILTLKDRKLVNAEEI
jgi:putative ABC transport system ATP-binding protein